MATKAVASCLAVHVRFPYTVNSMANLRYIYQQFQTQGHLVHWTDYFTKAGYSHHSSRSMGVFMLDAPTGVDPKWQGESLRQELEGIVGIALLRDYQKLVDGEVNEIEPVFTNDKTVKVPPMSVSHATVSDPFFRITDAQGSGVTGNDVRIDKSYAIPMVITVQKLS